MLNMKKLDKEALPKLKEFSHLAQYNEYNSNVVTMVMWDHQYEVFYELHEYFALILVNYHHRYGWLMPLCEEKYLKEAFSEMENYSKKHHLAYEIHGMNQKLKTFCEQNDIHFVYHNDINAQDYVYDIEMQRSLSGKKMQKRRNHFNAFIKEYKDRFVYQPLRKEDREIVFEFLEIWKNNHADPKAIENEMIGIARLFDWFDELQLKGGCIYIDGKLTAFSIYSELSDTMIQMHVEKADHAIRGLYVAILKYTLMDCDEKYLYLNREDDLGLESLRKAKSDLHPIFKIKKYVAYQGETKIIKASDEYYDQIKKLWLDSFPDEDEASTDFYFTNLYKPENTSLLVHESKVICMLQIREMELFKDGKIQKSALIVGVATNPYYQGCGYMRQLMDHVLEQSQYPFICIQAYNWELYQSFGFSTAYTHIYSHFVRLGEAEGKLCKDSLHLLNLYQQYTQNKDGYRIRDLSYYENYLLPYKQMDSEIWANEKAYLIVNQEHTLVSECIYTDKQALISLLNHFEEINVCSDIDFGNGIIRNSMMVKGDFERNASLFISENL